MDAWMGLSSLKTRQSSFPIAGSEDNVFISGTSLSSDKKINEVSSYMPQEINRYQEGEILKMHSLGLFRIVATSLI